MSRNSLLSSNSVKAHHVGWFTDLESVSINTSKPVLEYPKYKWLRASLIRRLAIAWRRRRENKDFGYLLSLLISTFAFLTYHCTNDEIKTIQHGPHRRISIFPLFIAWLSGAIGVHRGYRMTIATIAWLSRLSHGYHDYLVGLYCTDALYSTDAAAASRCRSIF